MAGPANHNTGRCVDIRSRGTTWSEFQNSRRFGSTRSTVVQFNGRGAFVPAAIYREVLLSPSEAESPPAGAPMSRAHSLPHGSPAPPRAGGPDQLGRRGQFRTQLDELHDIAVKWGRRRHVRPCRRRCQTGGARNASGEHHPPADLPMRQIVHLCLPFRHRPLARQCAEQEAAPNTQNREQNG